MNNGKKILALLTITGLSLDASAQALLTVKSPARKPASQVTYRQSGVPVFEMVRKEKGTLTKVKDIPKLDIGDERGFEAKELMITKGHIYYQSRKLDRVPREAVEEILGIRFSNENRSE